LHISYFLQNCKKGKSQKMDLPYWKTISQVLNQSQNLEYIAVNTGFELMICNRNLIHSVTVHNHIFWLNSPSKSKFLLIHQTLRFYGWLVLKYVGASFPNFIMTIGLFNGSPCSSNVIVPVAP